MIIVLVLNICWIYYIIMLITWVMACHWNEINKLSQTQIRLTGLISMIQCCLYWILQLPYRFDSLPKHLSKYLDFKIVGFDIFLFSLTFSLFLLLFEKLTWDLSSYTNFNISVQELLIKNINLTYSKLA